MISSSEKSRNDSSSSLLGMKENILVSSIIKSRAEGGEGGNTWWKQVNCVRQVGGKCSPVVSAEETSPALWKFYF